MSEFDHKAREWDNDPMHWERARAVADAFLRLVPLQPGMTALEFGAGTGILSFALADHFREITMMDNSSEMVRVMEEKVTGSGRKNLKPLFFDLGFTPYPESRFEVVFNQLVMHHVQDIPGMLARFREILFPGGFLVIADLCPEDGTFHKPGFSGHFGFDPQVLQGALGEAGFALLATERCYVVKKNIDGQIKEFPVFIMVSQKPSLGPDGRKGELSAFARRLVSGENGKKVYETYRNVIETVTPAETMMVLDRLLQADIPFDTVRHYTPKILNLFYKALESYPANHPEPGHFLHYLMLENREAEKVMAQIKAVTRKLYHDKVPDEPGLLAELQNLAIKLEEYELHYIKKENILFPWLEKKHPEYRCIRVMWSFHDDFRRDLKALQNLLRTGFPGKKQLNELLGDLFFVVLPVIFREEHIIFPVVRDLISEEVWKDMLVQSMATGWCYGIAPVLPEISASASAFDPASESVSSQASGDLINLGTGVLTPEQIMMMLNHMPVDVTFVDENDEVRYFSGGKHRIFPRSQAVIGRKVQNCHPQESVHVVEEILEAFRKGEKEHADFWIESREKFLHIRYFAVRDGQGHYRGTLEFSQDVTEIRALEGERRLLEWK